MLTRFLEALTKFLDRVAPWVASAMITMLLKMKERETTRALTAEARENIERERRIIAAQMRTVNVTSKKHLVNDAIAGKLPSQQGSGRNVNLRIVGSDKRTVDR